MIKANLILGLLALFLFGTAQHQGWNLFYASAQPPGGGWGGGGAGSGSRVYHK